jgi:hypothetical protein
MINLGFLLRENLLLYSSYLPLGVPNWVVILPASSIIFWCRCWGKRRLLQGEFHAHILYFVLIFCFTLLLLALFYQKYKKISILYSCFYLSAFSFARMAAPENTKLCDFTSTNNSDFICTPIVPPAPAANFYEFKPALLNLVMKEQFFGASTDDAVAHLNNFVELCEMQKYKDVESDIIKLKLLRIGCCLCLKIVLIHGLSVRMLLLVDTTLLLRL